MDARLFRLDEMLLDINRIGIGNKNKILVVSLSNILGFFLVDNSEILWLNQANQSSCFHQVFLMSEERESIAEAMRLLRHRVKKCIERQDTADDDLVDVEMALEWALKKLEKTQSSGPATKS